MAKTILMIHGFGCAGDSWAPVAERLRAEGYRVETPTLRAEQRNDELSVSYLANLLTSEPENDELRILLAERHFSLGQTDRAEAAMARIVRAPELLDAAAAQARFFQSLGGRLDAKKGPDVGEAQA